MILWDGIKNENVTKHCESILCMKCVDYKVCAGENELIAKTQEVK